MKSKVTGPPCWASAAAVVSVWTLMFLLLIFAQLFSSLVLHAGVFILSTEVLISPFRMCLKQEHGGEVDCYPETAFLSAVVILGLYIPVVLVAFALLAMLLSAYTKDRAVLGLSAAFQAASGLLTLIGIVGFVLQHWAYVSWGNMTVWFYLGVCVQAELLLSAAMTCVSQRRLTSDNQVQTVAALSLGTVLPW